MANQIKYIRRRANGVFQFERRVPQSVLARDEEWQRYFGRAKLFRKSLGTRHEVEALRAGEKAHNEFELRVGRALGVNLVANEGGGIATRTVTPEILAKLSSRTRELVCRPWARQVVRSELGAEDSEELDRMMEQREFDAEQLRSILFDRNASADPRLPNIAERAADIIDRECLDAPEGSNERAIISRAVREGFVAGHREIDDILDGKTSAVPLERLKASRSEAPTISTVVGDYILKLSAPRTVREVQGALKSFVAVIGDLPLDEISRSDMMRFCEVEGNRTIGGKDPNSIVRPISPETLKKKIGLLRSAINRAINTDRYDGPNPAANIDVRNFARPVPRELMPEKRPFSVHELQLILRHPWFAGCESVNAIHDHGIFRLEGMHYWAPILAMYTGCRAGELGGLRLDEIRLDHPHPHLVIRDNVYRTTKGSYRRNVPVLDVLLDHGFGDFVDRVGALGHDRLFHDWKAPAGKTDASANAWSNGSVIRSFNRTVVRQQLKSILLPDARQEVTFHGFRGAFKSLLGRREYGIPYNSLHEVIGHAKSALDKRYVGEIPLVDTYASVRACRYEGLILPPAP